LLHQDQHGSGNSIGGDYLIPKISPWKKDRVSTLTDLLKQDGVLGIIDVAGVPATAMLGMRATLRGSMTMTMAKKSLLRLAWADSGLSGDELEALLDGVAQPMIVHSDSMSAYQLFDELQKTRTGRAAKEGDIAPEDIVIPKGPTTFPPGPIVGEFNSVGIPAKIEKGKVAIQKTVTPVKKGEEISAELGMMLSKLEINPIRIGLILSGAIQDGLLMNADELDLDIDGTRNTVISAAAGAFNLACSIGWFTEHTVAPLISKAASEALSVAVEAGISNEKTMPIFISKANAHMLAVASQLDSSALSDELADALGAASAAPTTTTTEAAPEDAPAEEEEEEEEEAEFGGLGDLFG